MDKLKTIIITVLATLGVLFIVIMLIPDDEEPEDAAPAETQIVQEASEDAGSTDEPEDEKEQEAEEETATEDADSPDPAAEENVSETAQETEAASEGSGAASVDIPASEISDKTLKFRTSTLDGKTVDQDIFSGYDITLVHVWGTYCGPCIAEMGDYARSYKNLPENVNIIGIVCDVYDGLDNNADDAKSILGDAGAEFTNILTSDSVYEMTSDISVIPSSFFVDRQGHIIGEKMVGAHHKETMERLYGYMK